MKTQEEAAPGWRRKRDGGKQSFKAGMSQLQGESLSSGQVGMVTPIASTAEMPKLARHQLSSEWLHRLVELQSPPSQEDRSADGGKGLPGVSTSPG